MMNVVTGEYKLIGIAATAAVMSYAAIGDNSTQFTDNVFAALQNKPPLQLNYPYMSADQPYRVLDVDELSVSEQVEILASFANNILSSTKKADPEFTKLVDENFWDLM
jgi:hypothetical protein